MNLNDLQQMYLTELQELHSVEDQLVQALPKMAEKAENPKLKNAIQHHLVETDSHRARVEDILRRHNVPAREHTDQSMQALIRESQKLAGMVDDPHVRDAGLIGSAQRLEHYEIAAYGTVACWAKQLGHQEDLQTLVSILDEEKHADEKLTEIAKQSVNAEAVR